MQIQQLPSFNYNLRYYIILSYTITELIIDIFRTDYKTKEY